MLCWMFELLCIWDLVGAADSIQLSKLGVWFLKNSLKQLIYNLWHCIFTFFSHYSNQRLKRPVQNIGWNRRRQPGPIHPAVYTVSTTSSLLIFLRNISCPCPMTRVITEPLSKLGLPWPTVAVLIMASPDYSVVLRGSGNGKYRIINWPGKHFCLFVCLIWIEVVEVR